MFCGVALASFGSWYFGGNTGQGFHSHQPSFVLPPSLTKFSGNVQFSKPIPFDLSHSAATSGPTFCGVTLASVGSWYFGRIMWARPSFKSAIIRSPAVASKISASRYMSQNQSSTQPNLSFNRTQPWVAASSFGHSDISSPLSTRLTVGPVNFVR